MAGIHTDTHKKAPKSISKTLELRLICKLAAMEMASINIQRGGGVSVLSEFRALAPYMQIAATKKGQPKFMHAYSYTQ